MIRIRNIQSELAGSCYQFCIEVELETRNDPRPNERGCFRPLKSSWSIWEGHSTQLSESESCLALSFLSGLSNRVTELDKELLTEGCEFPVRLVSYRVTESQRFEIKFLVENTAIMGKIGLDLEKRLQDILESAANNTGDTHENE